jgi:putative SOS response-associated peptidase YedK
MCYYSSISVGFKIIETRFGVSFVQSESYHPVYSASAFTFPSMPVITNDDPSQVSLLHWGLIPFWVNDEATALHIRQHTLNARGETVFNKPAFRHCIVTKRCLVLVDGFFEWRHVNKKKYPYYIRLTDHQPFALAGIWDRWQNRDTEAEVRTFSVITTEANSMMAQIHNARKRMPVILTKENEEWWIDNKLESAEIIQILKSFDANKMEAYPVDRSITKLGFNTANPSILNRKEYEDLPPLKEG